MPSQPSNEAEVFKTPEPNGYWNEYQRLVLAELKRLDRAVQDVSDEVKTVREEIESRWSERITQIKVEVAILQTKCTLYGAIAGVLAAGAIQLAIRLAAK